MKKPTSKQTRLFQAKMFPRNGTTQQFFHMARASLERRYGELWRLKVDVEKWGA